MTGPVVAHDDYKRLELQPGQKLGSCPVCGSETELWQYSTSTDSPVTRVVMCSNSDAIGPRNGIVNEGCLLYMPPNDFYQATAREAIKYFNEFADALFAQRIDAVVRRHV